MPSQSKVRRCMSPGEQLRPGHIPLPGTVSETAGEAKARGGEGIAVAVDHANDEQVAALFAQVKRERGRLEMW